MNNKVLAAIVAGGLVVGAGLVTSVVSAPSTASAQEQSEDTDERGPFPRALGFLDGVLEGLVDDGTIDQDQADAILDATEERAGELREQWEGRDPHHRGHPLKRGFRFGALLDDGGIDQDEYDALADDHPLKQADISDSLEDGLITPEELREIFRSHHHSSDQDA